MPDSANTPKGAKRGRKAEPGDFAPKRFNALKLTKSQSNTEFARHILSKGYKDEGDATPSESTLNNRFKGYGNLTSPVGIPAHLQRFLQDLFDLPEDYFKDDTDIDLSSVSTKGAGENMAKRNATDAEGVLGSDRIVGVELRYLTGETQLSIEAKTPVLSEIKVPRMFAGEGVYALRVDCDLYAPLIRRRDVLLVRRNDTYSEGGLSVASLVNGGHTHILVASNAGRSTELRSLRDDKTRDSEVFLNDGLIVVVLPNYTEGQVMPKAYIDGSGVKPKMLCENSG